MSTTKKTQTTSYHPQCNGQTERCMGVILASLSKHLDEVHNMWDQYLPFTQFVHNTTPCLDSTSYTPSFLVYGRTLRTPLDSQLPQMEEVPKSAQQFVADLVSLLELARRDAEQSLLESKENMVHRTREKVHDQTFQSGRHRVSAHSSINCRADQKACKTMARAILCRSKIV